jgi:hypothetical protein
VKVTFVPEQIVDDGEAAIETLAVTFGLTVTVAVPEVVAGQPLESLTEVRV